MEDLSLNFYQLKSSLNEGNVIISNCYNFIALKTINKKIKTIIAAIPLNFALNFFFVIFQKLRHHNEMQYT